ncbi:hypothetical protein MN116_002780 [Schistosoma mekongi]|uniref:Uncharacterized protein n=1 Tax=Schistosoma mekongi TaxID=38744 RepID=A0AAE1ZHN1_SCHME|nr:hypothetical protein MN116_002780 [Schistosoma mekongi]
MMKKEVSQFQTPDEQLTRNENMINEYALNYSENNDSIFKMLCECIAYSRMLYEVKDWHHAQYQCCLGYFYITFRGENHALQAESHAENSLMLYSYYLNFINQQINQQNFDSSNNLIIPCMMLLNYYTLSKSKLILKKNKEAFNLIKQTENLLNKVEELLNLIQNSKIISPNSYDHNDNLEELKKNLNDYYQQLNHCTLLRLDRNFYPNLKILKLQIYCLYGKIAFEYKKYIVSFDQYIKALRLIEEIYGSESKETITIYHALGHIEEYKNTTNDMNRSTEYFKKAYEISNKIYNEKRSFNSLVDLARSVYQLCTTCMKYNLNLENTEHHLDVILQILNTCNEQYAQNSNEYQIDKKSIESNDLMKVTNSSSDNDNYNNKRSTDQCFISSHEYSNEYFVNLTCSLRSLLVKIYIKSNRHQEALKLLQWNLNLQEDTYGIYNIRVIKTRKLILSINMVQENFIEAVNEAEICLDLERFTFGTNSKQVKKTQEILEVLSSYKKSGNGVNSLH